jgi:hypothetical protein
MHELQLEDYWRAIVLLGRNSASYKFALARTLLDLKPESGQLVTMEDIAPIFSQHIANHLKVSERQGTSKTNKYFEACQHYNNNQISHDELTEQTLKLAFNEVIDRFHNVNKKSIDQPFYIDERKLNKGIKITDNFSELLESMQAVNLVNEVEARWDLVQTAWQLKLGNHHIYVEHDNELNMLFVGGNKRRRKNVASSLDSLNGYQKGKCFYCCNDVHIDGENKNAHVDHFLPHMLHQFEDFRTTNLDAIWNLVIACETCNNGPGGKFELVPHKRYLERLLQRNEFLIESHHPLKETLIQQTGKLLKHREKYLREQYLKAYKNLIHTWNVEDKAMCDFEQSTQEFGG